MRERSIFAKKIGLLKVVGRENGVDLSLGNQHHPRQLQRFQRVYWLTYMFIRINFKVLRNVGVVMTLRFHKYGSCIFLLTDATRNQEWYLRFDSLRIIDILPLDVQCLLSYTLSSLLDDM